MAVSHCEQQYCGHLPDAPLRLLARLDPPPWAAQRRVPPVIEFGILPKRDIASGALINVSGQHGQAQRVTGAR
jgi:hypothetical protein